MEEFDDFNFEIKCASKMFLGTDTELNGFESIGAEIFYQDYSDDDDKSISIGNIVLYVSGNLADENIYFFDMIDATEDTASFFSIFDEYGLKDAALEKIIAVNDEYEQYFLNPPKIVMLSSFILDKKFRGKKIGAKILGKLLSFLNLDLFGLPFYLSCAPQQFFKNFKDRDMAQYNKERNKLASYYESLGFVELFSTRSVNPRRSGRGYKEHDL